MSLGLPNDGQKYRCGRINRFLCDDFVLVTSTKASAQVIKNLGRSVSQRPDRVRFALHATPATNTAAVAATTITANADPKATGSRGLTLYSKISKQPCQSKGDRCTQAMPPGSQSQTLRHHQSPQIGSARS